MLASIMKDYDSDEEDEGQDEAADAAAAEKQQALMRPARAVRAMAEVSRSGRHYLLPVAGSAAGPSQCVLG